MWCSVGNHAKSSVDHKGIGNSGRAIIIIDYCRYEIVNESCVELTSESFLGCKTLHCLIS